MRRVLSCTALAIVLLVGFAQVPAAATAREPRLPERMAAVGDSITRAADVCCWYGDHPANSWSTGAASWDGVRSHYERLLPLDPDIAGRNFNLAVSGARMSDGPRQAQAAVDRAVHSFTKQDVSKLDYFHPSLTGQAHLAEVTWQYGYWGG
jgi:hypothetical protein